VLALVAGPQSALAAQVQPPPAAEEASALLRQARNAEGGNDRQALALLEDLIQRFGPATGPGTRQLVLAAMKDRGAVLLALGEPARAEQSDAAFAERYGKDGDDFFRQTSLAERNGIADSELGYLTSSLLGDIHELADQGRFRMELLELDDLLRWSSEDWVQADALLLKSRAQASLHRGPEAMATRAALLKRFQEARTGSIAQRVFEAMFDQAADLSAQGQLEPAIQVYDAIQARWQAEFAGLRPAPLLGKALQLKAFRLLDLHRQAEARDSLDASFRARGIDPDLPPVQKIDALVRLAEQPEPTGWQAEGQDLEIMDAILSRYDGASEPAVRFRLLDAWRAKAHMLSEQNRFPDSERCVAAFFTLLGPNPEAYFQDWITRQLLERGLAIHGPEAAETLPGLVPRSWAVDSGQPDPDLPNRPSRPNQARLAQLIEDSVLQRCRLEAEPGFKSALVSLYSDRAKRLMNQGHEAEALRTWDTTLQAGKGCKRKADQDRMFEAMFYRARLLGHGESRSLDQAVAAYDQALAYWRAQGRKPDCSMMFNVLEYKGITLSWQGKQSQALKVLNQALRHYNSDYVELEDKMELLTFKAVALDETGHEPAAFALYDEIIARLEPEENFGQAQLSVAMANKAILLERKGQKAQALLLFQEVLKRFQGQDLENRLPIKAALVRSCALLNNLGRPDEAMAMLNQALARFKAKPDPGDLETQAELMIEKGRQMGQQGDLEAEAALNVEAADLLGAKPSQEARQTLAQGWLSLGYWQIMRAKRTWAEPGQAARVAQDLADSLVSSHRAERDLDPSNQPVVAGNVAYARFLSGQPGPAEAILRDALKHGGQRLRDGELEDAGKSPVPLDAAFIALVNRIWAELARTRR
jgi:tetratricopeptide (TPR) repeat protein